MNHDERMRLLAESQKRFPGIDQPFPTMTREEMRAANQEVVSAISQLPDSETSSVDEANPESN